MLTSSRLLAGLAVLASAAIAGWIWWPSEPVALRAAPETRTESALGPALPTPPVPAASAPRAIASGEPSVVLSGVVVGVGGGNLAIVSIDRRPETMLRVGDAVSNTGVVSQIDENSMTYDVAGQPRRVVVEPGRSVAATAKAAAPAKPLPGFVTGAPPMARASGVEPGSGNDNFRQAVARKAQAIAAGK